MKAATLIGDWSFELAFFSTKPGVYFVSSHKGETESDTYTSIDFYCDAGKYSLAWLPPPNPLTGRNDLPDGLWQVGLSINNQMLPDVMGRSKDGLLQAPVKVETITSLALASTREGISTTDVLTLTIQKIDGGGAPVHAINYPATRFRAAIKTLQAVCTNW